MGKTAWVRAAGAFAIGAVIVSAMAGPAVAAPPKGGESRAAESKGGGGAVNSASPREVYWVQIGAFRDAQTAKRVAQRLREQKYPVQESIAGRQALDPQEQPPAGASGDSRDRYEVIVTGGSGSDVATTLAAKGLTSRAAAEGAAITPALSLGEAVALSKDLSGDGLAVRVRRAETAGQAAPRPTAPRADGEGFHRVRVGSYADRAAAEAAMKELESRGYKPVLTRGAE